MLGCGSMESTESSDYRATETLPSWKSCAVVYGSACKHGREGYRLEILPAFGTDDL